MVRPMSLRWLLAILALVLIAQPIHAADEDAKPAKEKPTNDKPKSDKAKSENPLQGYYSIIAKELGFSEEQKAKLTASRVARNEAIKKWDEANAAKVAELTAAVTAAKNAKDGAATKKTSDELKALQQGRNNIEEESKAKFQALLTPEQKSHLHGYNLHVAVMNRLSNAAMTDEQKAKAKAIAIETGKALAPDVSAVDLAKARLDLTARVEKGILTDAQRETMAKIAAEKAKSKSKAKESTGKEPTKEPAKSSDK